MREELVADTAERVQRYICVSLCVLTWTDIHGKLKLHRGLMQKE